jgi:hypothetical protein
VTGRTAFEGQVVHIHDVTSDPEYTATEAVSTPERRCIGGPE